jgi:uncharacterized membrane protein
VKYIVVGQLERNLYAPQGLSKFAANDGGRWKAVFQDAGIVIYEVK